MAKTIEMPESPRTPMAVFENTFFEVFTDHVTKVNMTSYEVTQVQFAPFPEPLQNPSFMQLGTTLMVQNLKNLFFFNLTSLEWKIIDDFCDEPLENAMFVVKEPTKIQFIVGQKLFEYNTQTFKSEPAPIAFDGAQYHGFYVRQNEFLATQQNQIVLFNTQNSTTQILFQGENMSNCIPAIAGSYLLLTDQSGNLRILETSIVKSIIEFRPQLQIMMKAKKSVPQQ